MDSKFHIVKTLGQGSFGRVLLISSSSGLKCAMKIQRGEKTEDVQKIWNENEIHSSLSHPSIVPFYGAIQRGNIVYSFMKYAPNGTLHDQMKNGFVLPHAVSRRYFKQLMDGVQYIHQRGILHGDLKPQNLLVDSGDNLMIADFGLSLVYGTYSGIKLSVTGVFGTRAYQAPEFFDRPEESPKNCEAIDVWSCGIILVKLLTGMEPWKEAIVGCAPYDQWKQKLFRNIPWWPALVSDFPKAVDLVLAMLDSNCHSRITIESAVELLWTQDAAHQHQQPASGGLFYLPNMLPVNAPPFRNTTSCRCCVVPNNQVQKLAFPWRNSTQ